MRDYVASERKTFSIRVMDEGPVSSHLALDGELDLAACDELHEEIRRLGERDVEDLVVDLRGLQYIDSSGIALLVHVVQEARESGMDLRFIEGRKAIHRVFEISGLTEMLPFEQSR